MKDLTSIMHLQLATHGIVLDDPKKGQAITPSPRVVNGPVDRQRVRELLSPKVPAKDLGWLTDSCPSVQDAKRFVMPRSVR